MTRALRVCLIASSRFPVAEPFAGGLESYTHQLATALVARGHQVSLFAGPGSDPALPVVELPVEPFGSAATDHFVGATTPQEFMTEHHAYLRLMLALARGGDRYFDLVHNNSLHHLPVAMAESLRVPVVTTLHTPPVPWLESAIALADGAGRFVSVSDYTRKAWASVTDSDVVHNGVDLDHWTAGPGGSQAVWSGRLVPEKAPHEAIDAARLAGLSLVLAGPAHDDRYYRREILPRLGVDVRHVGHLGRDDLRTLVAESLVALVTPDWDEPYGLVAAEAMACGTPVAAYSRGALPELVTTEAGRLARAGDVAGLARAAREAAGLDRAGVRASVRHTASLSAMVDGYEAVYHDVCPPAAVA